MTDESPASTPVAPAPPPTGDAVDAALAESLSAPVPEEAATAREIQEYLEALGRRTMPSAMDVWMAAQQGLTLERSAAIDQQVGENQVIYEKADRQMLLDALADRDRTIAQLSRQLADGKMTGNYLRELVRGLLMNADEKTLAAIERVLALTGAEPADARQLKLKGTTL